MKLKEYFDHSFIWSHMTWGFWLIIPFVCLCFTVQGHRVSTNEKIISELIDHRTLYIDH